MADLSKIKVGDKLRLEVEALRVCEADTKSGWQVEVRTVSRRSACGFLSGGLVEAAEHIPAPRVFKRGDWVQWRENGAIQMVVADADDELVWVTSDDPANNIIWRKQDCEPAEAPE